MRFLFDPIRISIHFDEYRPVATWLPYVWFRQVWAGIFPYKYKKKTSPQVTLTANRADLQLEYAETFHSKR